MRKISTKVKKVLNVLFRVVIFIVAYAFVYVELRGKWPVFIELRESFEYSAQSIFLLFLTCALMLVNWGIESSKWKFLLRRISPVSFAESVKSVLVGVVFSSFMPGRVGEFVGRVLSLKKAEPWRATFLSVIGSLSQLLVTLALGCVALGFFLISIYVFNEEAFGLILAAFFVALLLVFLFSFFLFNAKVVVSWIRRFTPCSCRYLRIFLSVFSGFSKKDIGILLLYSLVRYLCFSAQFVILLQILGVEVSIFHCFLLVFIIYFLMSAIPSFALADLGIRGSISIGVFQLYASLYAVAQEELVWIAVLASSLVWLINLLIPALIGSFFIFKVQIFRKEKCCTKE